jgi:hypothetical protein
LKVTIRKLKNKTHEYFAYLKGLTGKATYLLHFEDNIYGAITLNHFIQMLRTYFKEDSIEIGLHGSEINITSDALKKVLDQAGEAND